MSHSNVAGLAAIILLLGAAGCEGRRQRATGAGMLSDSAPPAVAGDTTRPQPGKPAPFPAEPAPSAGAEAGGMVEDTAARRAVPGAGEKPVPMPAEPRPSAER